MSRTTQPRMRGARLQIGKSAIGRKGSAAFAVAAFALLALASSASAAPTVTATETNATQAGTVGSPQPVAAVINTTTENTGNTPVGRTSTLTQTFPSELINNLASFEGCPETSYDDGVSKAGGAEDPTVSCPAGSIVGNGSFESIALSFEPHQPVTSEKGVIVKDSTTGGLAFWGAHKFGSGFVRGTVGTNGSGQTTITWDVGSTEALQPTFGSGTTLLKFNTRYNDNQATLQPTELFSNTGCSTGTWEFTVDQVFDQTFNTTAPQSASASASCPLPPVAPENTSAPTIAGVAQVGNTLTESDGTWTGRPTPTFSRQWESCDSSGNNCTEISGATGTTYTVQPADVGSTIRVVVTATNSEAPSGVSASSAPSGVVTNFTQTNGNGPLTVHGQVPLTEALELSSTSLDLGTLFPGLNQHLEFLPNPNSALYATGTVATVTSSTTTAELTISDPDATHPGQLQQGSYYLPEPLNATAEGSAAGATYSGQYNPSPIQAFTAPTNLVSYGQPVANDDVSLGFLQVIGATTPLHTGTYSKTFTVTLAETSP